MRDPYQLVDKIDEMKIRTREDLYKLIELYKNPMGIILGVSDGQFSEHLLSRTGENLTLYGSAYWSDEKHKNAAADRLVRFGSKSIIVESSVLVVVERFKDDFFDFIYINEPPLTGEIEILLEALWPKLKKGGILSGNEYMLKRKGLQISASVDEFVRTKKQELFLTHEEGKPRSFYLFKNMAL